MVMPASVIIVGGAVEPELSKPFNENDVLHNDAHASLEHTLAVVEVPEADVRRDPAEICVNVVHKTLIHRRKETRVREKHTVDGLRTHHRETPNHRFVQAVEQER